MSIWNMAFLALVLFAFITFIATIIGVHLSLLRFDAKQRRARHEA